MSGSSLEGGASSAAVSRQHLETRLGSDQRHQFEEIVAGEGHATLGRRVIFACDVEEDGAAPFALGRVVVVAHDDDEIVETVVAPHLLVAPFVGNMDQPVVGRGARVVAPAIVLVDRRGPAAALWAGPADRCESRCGAGGRCRPAWRRRPRPCPRARRLHPPCSASAGRPGSPSPARCRPNRPGRSKRLARTLPETPVPFIKARS